MDGGITGSLYSIRLRGPFVGAGSDFDLGMGSATRLNSTLIGSDVGGFLLSGVTIRGMKRSVVLDFPSSFAILIFSAFASVSNSAGVIGLTSTGCGLFRLA